MGKRQKFGCIITFFVFRVRLQNTMSLNIDFTVVLLFTGFSMCMDFVIRNTHCLRSLSSHIHGSFHSPPFSLQSLRLSACCFSVMVSDTLRICAMSPEKFEVLFPAPNTTMVHRVIVVFHVMSLKFSQLKERNALYSSLYC